MTSAMTLPWRVTLDGSTLPSRDEIGNKARSVAWMRSLGLNVPEAYVLPVYVGVTFLVEGSLPEAAWDAAVSGIADLESASGFTFGRGTDPLLVSVRSGAAQSMPGMMDTILDLGINDEVEAALGHFSGDAAFARDSHLRFLGSYARTVLGVHVTVHDGETPSALRDRIAAEVGRPVPTDPFDQLKGAIIAVFQSWNSPRAQAYRRHWDLPESGGTAVTVQRMVYGNLDDASGTGVLFTRNPHSGAREPLGEFLPRGQGEDVVSGTVDPLDLAALADTFPDIHAELLRAGELLEKQAKDVQDVEFTVERGRLFLLQTRNAKRSAEAALAFTVDFAEEGVIEVSEALARVQPTHVEALLQPVISDEVSAMAVILAKGDPACPGVVSGIAVCTPEEAFLRGDDEDIILVRHATSPEDIEGMIAARGICTEVGGRTSHAAVVSRELGRPSVVGCGDGVLASLAGRTITVDGNRGVIFEGLVPTSTPDPETHREFSRLLAWSREFPDVLPPDHPLLILLGGADPATNAKELSP